MTIKFDKAIRKMKSHLPEVYKKYARSEEDPVHIVVQPLRNGQAIIMTINKEQTDVSVSDAVIIMPRINDTLDVFDPDYTGPSEYELTEEN